MGKPLTSADVSAAAVFAGSRQRQIAPHEFSGHCPTASNLINTARFFVIAFTLLLSTELVNAADESVSSVSNAASSHVKSDVHALATLFADQHMIDSALSIHRKVRQLP